MRYALPLLSMVALPLTLAGDPALAGTAWIGHGGNYGSGGGPAGQLGTFEAPATFTPHQTYGRVTGVAYGEDRIHAYASTGNHTQGYLKAIDPVTGEEIASVLEPLNNDDADNNEHLPLSDLAFDPTTGLLYGAGAFGAVNEGVVEEFLLYTVDTADGARTLIGSAFDAFDPHDGNGMSIAFTDDGTLFALEKDSGYLAALDKTDASLISGVTLTLPPGAYRAGAGLGFDPDSGLLVASFVSDVSGDLSGLMSIDPTTYATAVLGDFEDGRQIHDIAFVPAVPLPGSLPLLGIGIIGLAMARLGQGPRKD